MLSVPAYVRHTVALNVCTVHQLGVSLSPTPHNTTVWKHTKKKKKKSSAQLRCCSDKATTSQLTSTRKHFCSNISKDKLKSSKSATIKITVLNSHYHFIGFFLFVFLVDRVWHKCRLNPHLWNWNWVQYSISGTCTQYISVIPSGPTQTFQMFLELLLLSKRLSILDLEYILW